MESISTRLLAILAAHAAADSKEAADMALIRKMIGQHPDLFSRACIPGHVTGSALVIDIGTGHILLHYHKSLGRWLQFGGHTEAGEDDPAQTALREAREESGLTDLSFNRYPASPLDIDVHSIPASVNGPEHLHLDFRYLLTTGQPDALKVEEGESDQFRWLTQESAAELVTEPALLRLINKAAAWFRVNSV